MANALYPLAKQAFLSAGIDMTSGTIKIALVRIVGGYTYSASHQWYSDLTPGSNVVGTPQTLTAISTALGVFDAGDVVFTTVSGPAVGAVVIYKDTGVAGTSPLIAYFDSVTGIPVVPNGGNITISFDSGPNKIFAL